MRDKQRGLDFLAQVATAFATSLEVNTTLRRLAELAARELADWVLIDVLDEDGDAVRVVAVHTASEAVTRPGSDAIPGWEGLAERIPVRRAPEESAAAITLPVETVRGERWISISGVEFFGGTVYAFRDLTEDRRLEELKADFLATASHELRTPLAAVYGAAQTLRRHDFALDEAGRDRFLSLIVEESERLSRIVNEILLANQLEAGRLDLATEPFDPTELV